MKNTGLKKIKKFYTELWRIKFSYTPESKCKSYGTNSIYNREYS